MWSGTIPLKPRSSIGWETNFNQSGNEIRFQVNWCRLNYTFWRLKSNSNRRFWLEKTIRSTNPKSESKRPWRKHTSERDLSLGRILLSQINHSFFKVNLNSFVSLEISTLIQYRSSYFKSGTLHYGSWNFVFFSGARIYYLYKLA